MELRETLQKLFDRSFSGMRAQGFKRAVDPNRNYSSCQYLSAEGLRCAVGQLIDGLDDLHWANNNGSVEDLFDVGENRLFRSIGIDRPADEDDRLDVVLFLRELQTVHDDYDDADIERGMRDMAKDHRLTVP